MLAVHMEGPGHMMHCVHIKFVRSTEEWEERIIEQIEREHRDDNRISP